MVALSTWDAEKWSTLQEWLNPTPETVRDERRSTFNHVLSDDNGQQGNGGARRLRQPQKRLTEEQTIQMCHKYREGATVYELGQEFGVDRRTAAIRLKKAGVKLRGRRT